MISVIVPVYNVDQYLNRCVESILRQSYSDIEVLLIDDGSTDHSSRLCDEWSRKDSRVKVIHKNNGGLSDARNVGIRESSGEYIGFVDSDDWIEKEMYERLLNALTVEQTDIAACAVQKVWEDGRPNEYLTCLCNKNMDRLEAQSALLAETDLKHPVWYKLYKRRLIEDIPFEVGKCHEDVFWSYQAMDRASKVSIIDYVGYYYWQRCNSIMGMPYSIKRLDSLEAVCRRYEYFKKNVPELEDAARRSIISHCIWHGQMSLKYLNEDDKKKALTTIKKVNKHYSMSSRNVHGMRLTHRMWFGLTKISFIGTCWLRNKCKVGW